MVEAARPRPIPVSDGQGSDTGVQSVGLSNSGLRRMSSEERAAYLEQKLLQQQSFYQAAKLEGAHEIRLPHERTSVILRQNDIMDRVLVKGENPASIADSYETDEAWVLSEFKGGFIRARNRSSLQLQDKFPEETIIPDESDTRKQKDQGREDNLVEQLQRDDIGSKEELENLMGRVSLKFYYQHRELFVNLRDFLKEQNVQVEGGYTSRVIQITSDLLAKEGIVIRKIPRKEKSNNNAIHIIWYYDHGEAIDLFNNQGIRVTVEAIIS